MNRQEILDRLKAFPYDRNEYWIVAGSAMVIYGIRDETGDIDLGCSARMADLLESDGVPFGRAKDGYRRFEAGEGMEIFEEWLYTCFRLSAENTAAQITRGRPRAGSSREGPSVFFRLPCRAKGPYACFPAPGAFYQRDTRSSGAQYISVPF